MLLGSGFSCFVWFKPINSLCVLKQTAECYVLFLLFHHVTVQTCEEQILESHKKIKSHLKAQKYEQTILSGKECDISRDRIPQ